MFSKLWIKLERALHLNVATPIRHDIDKIDCKIEKAMRTLDRHFGIEEQVKSIALTLKKLEEKLTAEKDKSAS